jgi:hypothetical protein
MSDEKETGNFSKQDRVKVDQSVAVNATGNRSTLEGENDLCLGRASRSKLADVDLRRLRKCSLPASQIVARAARFDLWWLVLIRTLTKN